MSDGKDLLDELARRAGRGVLSIREASECDRCGSYVRREGEVTLAGGYMGRFCDACRNEWAVLLMLGEGREAYVDLQVAKAHAQGAQAAYQGTGSSGAEIMRRRARAHVEAKLRAEVQLLAMAASWVEEGRERLHKDRAELEAIVSGGDVEASREDGGAE